LILVTLKNNRFIMQIFRIKICALLITISMMNQVYAQAFRKASTILSVIHSNPAISFQPGLSFPDYPLLELPESFRNRQLPASVDNSVYPFLRPVFQQVGASCGQSASIAYNFCYEIDRARNLPADTSVNQYPTHFTWNFLNYDDYWGTGVGVSYFRSFEILRNLGCPNEATYGPITFDDPYYWMSGYDNYHAAMRNRIKSVNSINLSTYEGLLTLKNWLNDHLDGSATGGVANFYTGINTYTPLPANSPEAGKYVIKKWNPEATHALTIVGYNDSIRFDLNQDGIYSNDIDINEDGKIDIKDWEIGGIKFVNSYGDYWADSGFCYALYSSLALKYGEGGIWNNAAHVITVEPDYNPLLTLKARISHTMRGRLKITAGVNADTNSAYPSTMMEFPVFNYQGGDYYMGGGFYNGDKEIEIGLDISPLLGTVEKGIPSRFFFMIEENDPGEEADGSVLQFSVISYFDETLEYNSSEAPCNIINNGKTTLTVVIPGLTSSIEIEPGQLPAAVTGSPVYQQLGASSGFPPYDWHLLRKYWSTESPASFIPGQGVMLEFQNAENGLIKCKLPFAFPFYGRNYDSVFVHPYGFLMLDCITGPYPYLQDAAQYLMQTKAIAPFMAIEHQIAGSGAGIWYESTPEKTVFTWVLDGDDSPSGLTDNFSATLFPDGRIIFSYGALDAEMSLEGIAAISAGDGFNYQYTDAFFTAPSSCITLIPEELPSGLSVNSQGLITSDTLYEDLSVNFDVLVTDSRHLHKEKSYLLTTGPFVGTTVNSGSDNIIEPGETATISLLVENSTGNTLHAPQFQLQSLFAGLILEDSNAVCQDLTSGQHISIPEAFRFKVSDYPTHDMDLIFKLKISWDDHSTEQLLSIPLTIRKYLLAGPLIVDGNNNLLEADESAMFQVRLTHGGIQPEETVTGILSSGDPYISISGPNVKTFDKTINTRYDQAEWLVTANPATPPGRIADFEIKAFNDNGDTLQEVMKTVIGKPAILVIDADNNKNSARHIISSLNQLGSKSDQQVIIDSNIFEYKQAFVCLGTKPLNHELTLEEANYLDAFLNQGNNLYLEGGSTFGSDDQYPVHDKFRIDPEKKAWYHPADTLAGDTLTFASGMTFDYRGDHTMAYGLIPLDPALAVFTDVNTGYHFVVANDSVTYRTIASTVEFGGIFPFGATTREEILINYLEFLDFKTFPLAANFSSGQSQACAGSLVEFKPHCGGSPLAYHWIFENGNPAESTDEVGYVQWPDPGFYNVSLTVSDGTGSNMLVKEKCIEVLNCSGTQEKTEIPEITVSPNPVKDWLTLNFKVPVAGNAAINISDLTGKQILSTTIDLPSAGASHKMNLSGLKPGVYILTFLNNQVRTVKKIVIQ
jgi:hypothetical protein